MGGMEATPPPPAKPQEEFWRMPTAVCSIGVTDPVLILDFLFYPTKEGLHVQ